MPRITVLTTIATLLALLLSSAVPSSVALARSAPGESTADDKAAEAKKKKKKREEEKTKDKSEKKGGSASDRRERAGDKAKPEERAKANPKKAEPENRKKADADKTKRSKNNGKSDEKNSAKADQARKHEDTRSKAEAARQSRVNRDQPTDAKSHSRKITDDQGREEKARKADNRKDSDRARNDPDRQRHDNLRELRRHIDRAYVPADSEAALRIMRNERSKADAEYEKAKAEHLSRKADARRGENRSTSRFEELRKKRRERVEKGIALIEEPDQRIIVRKGNRSHIRHDERRRLERARRELRRERRNGVNISVLLGVGGREVISEEDDEGRLLRRIRRERDGREFVLIDNRDFWRRHHRDRGGFADAYVDLPPPVLHLAPEEYVVDYDDATYEDVYEALIAPPVERLERGYSIEEVRQSHGLRERMRRVDLDAVNFDFASWEVDPSEYPKLERIAEAMTRIIERNPEEMFMIEGHTDAVGSDLDNLSLSDRRAESIAIILSDVFNVPPENMTTQGYGEEFLKVDTLGPSRENRRVAVRRVTPLLSRSERHSRE